MVCETCGFKPHTYYRLMFERGYWWHKKCVTLRNGLVDLGSGGKMLPDTIMTKEKGGGRSKRNHK